MQNLIEKHAPCEKEWFLAMYMGNIGIREKVAVEYYGILLKWGVVEEYEENGRTMIKPKGEKANE
jgi:hypothetical protein